MSPRFLPHASITCVPCVRFVVRSVSQEVTQQLVVALTMSRLDYCNSVLAGLLKSTLEPLQRVQNAAARLVFSLGNFDHVMLNLIQLHWLPVSYRVKFKLCCPIHTIYMVVARRI